MSSSSSSSIADVIINGGSRRSNKSLFNGIVVGGIAIVRGIVDSCFNELTMEEIHVNLRSSEFGPSNGKDLRSKCSVRCKVFQ